MTDLHMEAVNARISIPSYRDIRKRIEDAGASCFANENISEYIEPGELDNVVAHIEMKVGELLDALVIDRDEDHNTIGTARRVAKMLVHEVFAGRYHPPPKITSFPNAKHLDEVYTLGPITVRSACSHHLVPVIGRCWVGVMPGERVIGLSKFTRLIQWVMARPHIQEEAAVMLADTIESLVEPVGLGIIVDATHYCMKWRGVKENDTSMITSIMRGSFLEKPHVKAEFMRLIEMQQR
jgi:GTP cyclohydrolase I